ncbi:MAG: ATP-binding cassette domain-containing protein [Rhodocyclaceae bacterium]|nr:ATP-binding cassette domain-containing protein [Rhodocyclaceae bacterium]
MSFELARVGVVHGNGTVALENIELRARPGERIALVGPSGAGKTTLLRLLAASLKPSSGKLSLLGTAPWDVAPRELRKLRARIGMVHQSAAIAPRQRVVTAVLAGRLGRWPWWKGLVSWLYPLDPAGAQRELARLDLGGRLFERCDRLSGGQLQRVALARVLYQQPDLILADEPVSALDPALADLTTCLLNEEALERGVTLVASLHAIDLAVRYFPRVVGVRAGRIAFDCEAGAVSDGMLADLYATARGGDGNGGIESTGPAAAPIVPVMCR